MAIVGTHQYNATFEALVKTAKTGHIQTLAHV